MAFSENVTDQLLSSDTMKDGFTNQTSLYTYGARVAIATTVLVISLMGIVGNAIVLIAVAVSCRLQTVTNIFVANLSVADFLMSVCALFNTVILIIQGGPPTSLDFLCRATAFFSPVMAGVIMFSIASIAVNRMLLITKRSSIYRKIYTTNKLVPMVSFLWLFPTAITALLLATGVGQLNFNKNVHVCLDDSEHHLSGLYKIILAGVFFPVPVTVTLISYALIFVFIQRHFKNERRVCSTNFSTRTSSQEQSTVEQPVINQTKRKKRIHKHQIEITKNLFIVSCVCFILPLPNCVFIMLELDNLFLYGVIFLFANSAVNPMLYGAKHPMFKEVMLCILRCRWSAIPEPSRILKYFLLTGKR
ncbi:trace amine-associated receptor 8-like [Asterias amurensis]|uniref:trace amine-associated receptor 8-like n=1 Tax=Asterias amurensis TaxID=7602 RepID=UPI003AB4F363